ncbi:MAG: PD-(D/E)XK nuclease family protein, partial [Dermatophilaceae bacterium]|nr:PD-(D/E)XK nuclease family protein [Dermatophilaceae bacterium]
MPTPLYSGSPSRLLAYLDCPRRYRMQYLDRPRPLARPQRAHTSVGIATHNVLRDFWDLPVSQRTPAGVAELVRTSWIDVGFRDPEQSAAWRLRVRDAVTDYLRRSDRDNQPVGIERSVSLKTDEVAITGRIDRLDDRDGELVVVDYKTGRQVPTDDDASTSLPLAMYAVASARMFRRPCRRVELH